MSLVSSPVPIHTQVERGRERTRALFQKSRGPVPGVVVYFAHFTFGGLVGLRWDQKWTDSGSQSEAPQEASVQLSHSRIVCKRFVECEQI